MSRRVFEAVPHPYLILDRDFRIVDFNSLYSQLTMTDPALILGRNIFDAFPENPEELAANGMKNATASFEKVLKEKVAHQMPFQRYDIRDSNGLYMERYWKATNCPILDDNGEVEFILHSTEDVTAVMKRFWPRFKL